MTEYFLLAKSLFVCFAEFSKSLDCYIRAVTMCNSLALLVSQCSPSVFAARIALLDTLQKCWSNGHSILKLVCSCDGAIECISDVVLHELSVEFTSNLDIESADWYNNNASSGITFEQKSECPNTSESVEQRSIVATLGCEPVFSISVTNI